MSILALTNRVKKLESNLLTSDICALEEEGKLFKLIMALQEQISKLEEQLIKEMNNRQADYELIERLDKRIRELELRTPKKRGRKPKPQKLSSEDFD